MSDIGEQIKKAIGVHGMWKQRLLTAVKDGAPNENPAEISKDNRCEFGQWLHSCGVNSPHHKDVVTLHAEFHKTAAKVIELAKKGAKQDASKLIDTQYADASAKLTAAMLRWKSAV